MFSISALSSRFDQTISDKINHKTKPLGALGQLEGLAAKLAKIQSNKANELIDKLAVTKPQLFVFAADHGIARQGVSIAPSEVTQQMVLNFVAGGAAVNVFCRQFGWHLEVVDAGILAPLADYTGVTEQRVACGTKDLSEQPAMSVQQTSEALTLGHSLISKRIKEGVDLVAFGEMGIGNTSSASAIMAAVLGLSAKECVGAGTGIDQSQLDKKIALVEKALLLHQVNTAEPVDVLAKLGGFEIAQIVGGILAAAEQQVPVVIDGFICTAAAMIAKLIDSQAQEYMIFAHCSDEQGHKKMLAWFEEQALLNLGMRLGEGSGAALSLPIIQSAMAFYNDMASFQQADVDDVVN